MMFTARMKYLVAVMLDRHADAVTKELLSLSLLHFVKVQELQIGLETKVNNVALTVSTARLAEIRKRIESLLAMAKALPDPRRHVDLQKLSPIDLDAAEKKLADITTAIQTFRDRQKAVQQEILKLEDIKRQVALFGDLRSMFRSESSYSFLRFRAGSVQSDRLAELRKALEPFPSVALTFHEGPDVTSLLVITMKRDDAQVERIFVQYDFTEAEPTEEMEGIREEVPLAIGKKIAALTIEQETLSAESLSVVSHHKDALLELWENLKLNELYFRIQSFFSRTARTVLFSGWVPAKQARVIGQAIERLTGGSCYVEWRDPSGLEKETHQHVNVPVLLKNLKALSPFQMLVTNFSIPQYGTIDPTPIVAVIYLAMFGLMFGDVGQGLVMLAFGVLGTLFGRFKEGMRELVKLIAYCGAAAIGGGLLFGSFFGKPIFKAWWFDFHGLVAGGHISPDSPVQSLIQVLVITLWFGVAIISLGLVLNWINLIRTRRWLKLIFDRTGLVGSWMYAGGVYTVAYFANHGFSVLPDATVLIFALGLPTILFIGKPVTEFFEHKKHHPEKRFTPLTIGRFLFEWIIELLEFFAGYLSNTLSFMRVAGLGIAHVALMFAFDRIAAMASGGEQITFFSVIILVIGNIFVIGLEGLSAGIQSLRLNYYEFFSKYFRGSGEAYAPVSLGGS